MSDKSSDEYSPQFEVFWAAYPRKVAKLQAWKMWNKYKAWGHLPQILNTLREWSRCVAWTKDGGAFVPHPSSWLSGGRWEDCSLVETKREPTKFNQADVHHFVKPDEPFKQGSLTKAYEAEKARRRNDTNK